MDQRRKIIAATRLGIGPLANGKARPAESSPQTSLPSVGAASSRAAAAAAATERERRQKEADAAQKEDDTDLTGFLAGGKATKKAVATDRETQRKRVVVSSDLDAFLAGGKASAQAAAVVAQRATSTATAFPAFGERRAFPMPGQTVNAEARLAAPAPAAAAAPERPGERPFDPEPLPPIPGRQDEAEAEDGEEDDPRLAFLNEQRSAKRRAKKEEMRKKREEKLLLLREANAGRVDDDDDEDDELREADDSDSSDDQKRIRHRDGKISASKGMDGEMRRFWGESVKGRVSTDYKGFSDAELERRFAVQQAQTTAAGQKLMTEAEVLAMMMKGGKRDRSRSKKRRR